MGIETEEWGEGKGESGDRNGGVGRGRGERVGIYRGSRVGGGESGDL